MYIDNELSGTAYMYWDSALRGGVDVLKLAADTEQRNGWKPSFAYNEASKARSFAKIVWMTNSPLQPRTITDGHEPVITNVKKHGARPSADSALLAKLLPDHCPPPTQFRRKQWKRTSRVRSMAHLLCCLPPKYRMGLVCHPKVRLSICLRASFLSCGYAKY